MHILICGSSGFIGTHLADHLTGVGHCVTGFDLVPPRATTGLVRFIPGDIRVKADLWPALEGIDCVINLAAKHHDFGIAPGEYFDTNETGTRCLLECMADLQVDQFIFYSSVAVYGDTAGSRDESGEPAPTLPYGQSKLAAETAIRQWTDASFLRSALILRPALVFGPGNTANMYSLIRQIDRRLFAYFGARDTVKSTCYVQNLVHATRFCLERMLPGLTLYNYADKPDLTVEQMVTTIAEALGRPTRQPDFPHRLGLAVGGLFDLAGRLTGRHFRISAARVRKLAQSSCFPAARIAAAGFIAPYTLETGLRHMVQWYRDPAALVSPPQPVPSRPAVESLPTQPVRVPLATPSTR